MIINIRDVFGSYNLNEKGNESKNKWGIKLKSFYTMKENISRKKDSWGEEQKKIAC